MAEPRAFTFADRRIAMTLAQMAREKLGTPQKGRGGTVSYPTRQLGPLRAYLATPYERIPGARRVRVRGSDGVDRYRILLGSGLVCIHRRDSNTDADSWEAAHDGTHLTTRPHHDEDTDETVRVRVYNFCEDAIEPVGNCEGIQCDDTVLFVVEDVWGDLYIVKQCEFPCSSETASSSSSQSESSSQQPPPSSSSSESSASSAGSSASSQSSESESSKSVSSVSESESSVSVSASSVSASGASSSSLSESSAPSISSVSDSLTSSLSASSESESRSSSLSASEGSASGSASSSSQRSQSASSSSQSESDSVPSISADSSASESESESQSQSRASSDSESESESDTPSASEDCNATETVLAVTSVSGGPCEFTATLKSLEFRNGLYCGSSGGGTVTISTRCTTEGSESGSCGGMGGIQPDSIPGFTPGSGGILGVGPDGCWVLYPTTDCDA